MTFGLEIGELAASQKRDELLPFLDRVAAVAPRAVCEIGTSAGGTLYLLTRVAADDAVIVSVDLDTPPHLAAARKAWRAQASGSSASRETRTPSRCAIASKRRSTGGPSTCSSSTGDHSYEGVKRDWELYSPLVRAGGVIGLHDMQEDYATSRGTQTAAISGEVPRFWRELREGHRTEELIADPGQDGYGIGVVYP